MLRSDCNLGVAIMSKIVFALTLVVILALSYLALQNPTAVQLKLFHRGPTEIPLYMVIFGAFILGALFVYVLFLLQGVRGAFLGMREKRIRKRDETTDAHRQEAREQLRLGHLEKSQALLEKTIHLSPDNCELSLDLADVLLEREQYIEASDRYHHVFSRDPQNVRAILGIAISSEGTENFSEAELYYRRVLDIEKANPVALKGLLRAQKAQGKRQDAMGTLRLLRKEGLVSAQTCDETLAVLWYEQGMTKERSGDLKGSISCFEKSLKAESGFVPSILGLGDAYIRDGVPEKAVKIWEGALTEHFELPIARALESYMIQHEGDKELVQFYKKISSRSDLARLLLARLYLRQNLIEEAEGEISKIPEAEASAGALLILAEVEKKRLNEVLSNRYYSLTMELLHNRLDTYRCTACGTAHNEWAPRCRKCGAWNTLKIDVLLP
jgi:tetratricopeptide (TPR) repeat protein